MMEQITIDISGFTAGVIVLIILYYIIESTFYIRYYKRQSKMNEMKYKELYGEYKRSLALVDEYKLIIQKKESESQE